MRRTHLFVFLALILCLAACRHPGTNSRSTTHLTIEEIATEIGAPRATEQQVVEIEALIEQLVFRDGTATNRPVLSPRMSDASEEYRQRFTTCQEAFRKLKALKDLAFPILVAHKDDNRQSINFRNHVLENSVGYACYLIICYQLQDLPSDYSEYGYQRKGRDGKLHPKPYWEGSPFSEAGGMVKWLKTNKALTYPRKQEKCLRWFLEKEKAIGACDAESYFINILPLEIRILERRLESGDNVAEELQRLKKVLSVRDMAEVPTDLLPD